MRCSVRWEENRADCNRIAVGRQTLAELFIGLLGFSGIVAAIGRRSHGDWDPIERARLESLLSAGGEGVVLAIAPLVAASAGIAEAAGAGEDSR